MLSKIEMAPSATGIERMRAFFCGHAFAPHRHDTYAIGITTSGVQSFCYRGAVHHSLPGQVFVLHPDENHDGRAGDERGFGYRIAYIDPALIGAAGGVQDLPFLRDPVSNNNRLRNAVNAIVDDLTEPMSDLAMTCCLADIADALTKISGGKGAGARTPDVSGVRLAREFLLAATEPVAIASLEAISGLSRWQLARQFRRVYGVSPQRFHLLRRLERSRLLLQMKKVPLADIAQELGFSDQAHFSRHFRNAYGLSPGRWQRLCA